MYSDEDLREIFATAPVDESYIEIVAFKADWFSQDYYLQNKVVDEDGIEVVLETGETVTAMYAPMSLGQSSDNDDLNDERTISIQQVNDVIASELSNFDPEVDDLPYLESRIYIIYRDQTLSTLKSPVVRLPVTEISTNAKGVTLTASSKPVNDVATGIIASNKLFPMQKGIS